MNFLTDAFAATGCRHCLLVRHLEPASAAVLILIGEGKGEGSEGGVRAKISRFSTGLKALIVVIIVVDAERAHHPRSSREPGGSLPDPDLAGRATALASSSVHSGIASISD